MSRSVRCYPAVLKVMLALVVATWAPEAVRPGSAQSLPTPAMTGPLQTASLHSFDAGPFGKVDVAGVVGGIGIWQGSHVPDNDTAQGDRSNGQVFIQKTTGWWQFYPRGAHIICRPWASHSFPRRTP